MTRGVPALWPRFRATIEMDINGIEAYTQEMISLNNTDGTVFYGIIRCKYSKHTHTHTTHIIPVKDEWPLFVTFVFFPIKFFNCCLSVYHVT